MRRHERFDTSIPVQLNHSDVPEQLTSSLINVSVGGLCFSLTDPMALGDTITINLNHVVPPTELVGTIAWCRRFDDHFELGLEFSDQHDPFLTRMVKQICLIENYRLTQQREVGRELSSDIAAREWIEKYAASYAAQEKLN